MIYPCETAKALTTKHNSNRKGTRSKKNTKSTSSVHPSPVSQPSHSPARTEPLSGRELIAYRWSGGNSCFWDTAIEILYRCYRGLLPSQRNDLRAALFLLVPNAKKSRAKTPLQQLFVHFEERDKWIVGKGKAYKASSKYLDLLSVAQRSFRAIIEKWDIGEFIAVGDGGKTVRYGTAESVIGKLLSV